MRSQDPLPMRPGWEIPASRVHGLRTALAGGDSGYFSGTVT